MTHAVVLGILIVLAMVGLEVHGRVQKRARGDTLDVWCAGSGWRREGDRARARTVGRRVAGGVDGIEHVVVGTTADGREAVAVGSWTIYESGGGDSSSRSRRDDVHLAVRVRGHHPWLALESRPRISWGGVSHERRTGHAAFDARYRLRAVDGAHAAALLPAAVLDRLTAEPVDVPWALHGEWLTLGVRGHLVPPVLEWLLAYAAALAPDLEANASLTAPAGSPEPAPRRR